MQVFVIGYLFAYLQSIIHSTAVGDNEMPSPPSMGNFWEDILLPCLQLLALTAVCFGPALVLGWRSLRQIRDSERLELRAQPSV